MTDTTDTLAKVLILTAVPAGIVTEFYTGIENIGPGVIMLFAIALISLTEIRSRWYSYTR